MLVFDQAVVGKFGIAQQLGLRIGSGQQIEPAADLCRGQRRSHILDFLGEPGPVAVSHLIVSELGYRGLELRDLLVIGAQLGVELRLALRVIGFLQLAVLRCGRVGDRRRDVRPLRQLRLGPCNLRVEVGDLRFEGADIGRGEGRIERRQDVARLHPLALAHIDRLDDRGIERLDDHRRLGRDDLAGAVHDPVEPHKGREHDQADDEAAENIHRDAHAGRLRGL